MDTLTKLGILADAAKYDAACTSSGIERGARKGSLGIASSAGCCHSFTPDGRCVTLLKGHRSVVAFPGGRAYIIAAGNPGMAKGGSGDVLTGILAALLGQLPTERAAVAAAWLHAAAGDACAAEKGEYGMTPTDMIEMLPYVMKELTK